MSIGNSVRQRVREIAGAQNFELGELLREGLYYSARHVRDNVWSGSFRGKPAVLKVYDDPRPTNEPAALEAFHQSNHSPKLTAPRLYAYEITSAHSGWLIMEKLPEEAMSFPSRLSPDERREILSVYLEYRRNFPSRPTRPLTLAEELPAAEFAAYRLSRWLLLAVSRGEAGSQSARATPLQAGQFIPLYTKAISEIRRRLAGRPMQWCHGHFKSNEVFKTKDRYYLLDFAHAKMYHAGYELTILPWSDWLMAADNWQLDYPQWKRGVDAWLQDLLPVARELAMEDPEDLLRVSLLERTLGAVLGDVAASGRPRKEQEKRCQLLLQLAEDLL